MWHRHHQQHTALVMVTITIMIIFSVPRAPIIITTMIIAEHVITGATLGPDQGLIYFPGALPLPLAPLPWWPQSLSIVMMIMAILTIMTMTVLMMLTMMMLMVITKSAIIRFGNRAGRPIMSI